MRHLVNEAHVSKLLRECVLGPGCRGLSLSTARAGTTCSHHRMRIVHTE